MQTSGDKVRWIGICRIPLTDSASKTSDSLLTPYPPKVEKKFLAWTLLKHGYLIQVGLEF